MRRERFLGVALGTFLIAIGLGASWSVASDQPPEGKIASVAVRLYLTEGSLPTDDPNAASWNAIQPSEFNLAPQVHWPDRIQEVTVKTVKVRGMHNGQDLAVMVEYEDPTESPADAAALEFMVGDQKAHFAHGQEMIQVEGGPVNIWYWKKADGKGTDMSAKGFKTIRAQDQQDVSATGVWQGGTWRVVFSRPLATGDEHDVQITPGEWRSIAFAFWDGELVDGEAREKGSQKAVSSWWSVRAEPTPDNSMYGYVVLGIAIAAGFEFFLVRKIRRGNHA
ncbi:MAG: ethylbenzene dehydrogenase-related protein [Nitrospirae bacterium]|nr:ethylbenzene dehydrogenase-related protein [Nitrospirota bacterium]MDA1304186.1 ethylbenzene dehydrogenase-related protein [Nitrospirota bacterium]